MRKSLFIGLVIISIFLVILFQSAHAAEKPNVVFMMMDNLGWGEIGTYGGGVLRGAATPQLDTLAEEGMKLLNFNVENQVEWGQ